MSFYSTVATVIVLCFNVLVYDVKDVTGYKTNNH